MRAWSAIAIFLAATKLPLIGIERDRSSMMTVAKRRWASVRSTSKSAGVRATGVPGPLLATRVAYRPFDRKVERVAPFVRFCFRHARGQSRAGRFGVGRTYHRASFVNKSERAWSPRRRKPRGVRRSRPSFCSTKPESRSRRASWPRASSELASSAPSSRARTVDVDLGRRAGAWGSG